MKARILLALALTLGAVCANRADCDRAPREVVRALGTKRGKPISTGLVFIDGKYVKPPYHVTRAGNQILLNEHPVTGQLVSWQKFLETQPLSKVKRTEVEIPADESTSAGKAAMEEKLVNSSAPKDDHLADVRFTIVETRVAAGAEDFDDFKPNADGPMKLTDIPADTPEDKARQKRAEKAKRMAREEAQCASETVANAPAADAKGKAGDPPPAGEAGAKSGAKAGDEAGGKVKPAVRTRTVCTLEGAFEENATSRKLLQSIDKYRNNLEETLRDGGFIFFGTNPARKYCKRQKGAFASRDLLKKLPELMSKAEQSKAFCEAVQDAGLFAYINRQIAEDLFRHKADSFELKLRRRALEEEDKPTL